jgi:hypothetical protein
MNMPCMLLMSLSGFKNFQNYSPRRHLHQRCPNNTIQCFITKKKVKCTPKTISSSFSNVLPSFRSSFTRRTSGYKTGNLQSRKFLLPPPLRSNKYRSNTCHFCRFFLFFCSSLYSFFFHLLSSLASFLSLNWEAPYTF